MSSFFTETEAARRYAVHRPKVHGVIVDWLHAVGIRNVERAIDVACGTGDSTTPLLEFCDEAIGVDISPAMLAHARAKGLAVHEVDYSKIGELGRFDLITTCMAFHWFDPVKAISSFKAASKPGAWWLIYNFFFAGHSTNDAFNAWLRDDYLRSFPSPPRHRTADVVPRDDPEIAEIAVNSGVVPILMTDCELIDYLSTQTNVEEVVKTGRPYEDICGELLEAVRDFDFDGHFDYAFTYEIHRYEPVTA